MWTTLNTFTNTDKPRDAEHPTFGACRYSGNGWRVILPWGGALRSGHELRGRLRLFRTLDEAKAAAERHHSKNAH